MKRKVKFINRLKWAYQMFKHCDKMVLGGIPVGTECEYDGISPTYVEDFGKRLRMKLIRINMSGQKETVHYNPLAIFSRTTW